MAWTYKSYKAPGTRPPPPIFHEVSATGLQCIQVALLHLPDRKVARKRVFFCFCL